MGTFSRLRYVIAANMNALIEKAEDPEKLLRALIREMEDAAEEARIAHADLVAEQKQLQRHEQQLAAEHGQWLERAEQALSAGREDLARAALQSREEAGVRRQAAEDGAKELASQLAQLEQDMTTLQLKVGEARQMLRQLLARPTSAAPAAGAKQASPGERRMRRALGRFDYLQTRVDSLEARVRSYDLAATTSAAVRQPEKDPAVEAELLRLKQKLAGAETATASIAATPGQPA